MPSRLAAQGQASKASQKQPSPAEGAPSQKTISKKYLAFNKPTHIYGNTKEDLREATIHNDQSNYLRGAIVIRTHHAPKNQYILLFLHTILGPDYYVPT